VSLLQQLKCAHLVPAKAPHPEEAIFNQNQDATEKRHTARKAQHKKRQIAKRDRNDNRNKRRKAGEQGVSSDEDPSPELSWSGDVASAAVDWRNMSGSSSSSPPRGAEVSSSCRPREVRCDKTVGSSSRPVALPARVGQWSVRSHAAPSGTDTPEPQRPTPVKPTLLEGRRSDRCPSASFMTARTGLTPTPCKHAGRGGGHRISASTPSGPPAAEPSVVPRRLQSLLIRGGGTPDVHVSLVAEGAMVQLRPLQKLVGRPLSQWRGVLPP
jgi:hypothetical protein